MKRHGLSVEKPPATPTPDAVLSVNEISHRHKRNRTGQQGSGLTRGSAAGARGEIEQPACGDAEFGAGAGLRALWGGKIRPGMLLGGGYC